MPLLGNLIKRFLDVGEYLEQRSIDPMQMQRQVLRRLLARAQHTSFGQYYKFHDILRQGRLVDAFREQVPLFDYDSMYKQWWHMSLNGVENVSWRGTVRYFALSSGTSGAPSKHIPVTEEMTRAMQRAAMKMFFALSNFDIGPKLFTKSMLMLGGSSELEQRQDGYFQGDLSGINANKVPFWLRPYYKPGAEIAAINSWEKRIAEIARLAPEWDVGFLVGIPSWLQLMMERILERHQLDNIHQIWPNLKVCVHGGIAFEPLKKGFEKLLARPLVYMDTYLASEGFIAFQDRPGTRGMRLLLQNGIFLEFIPFNEVNFDDDGHPRGEPRTYTLEEAEPGVDYALAISTCAGAWRYLIGDTVRFTDTGRAEVIISGRTKHFLSICGEHLSVDNMNQGIQAVEEKLGVNIREFTVGPVEEGRYYAHQWYIGCEPLADSQAVREVLDQHLRKVNDDYRTERNSLLGIRVTTVPTGIFYQWQQAKGKMGGQNKFPRVMKGALFAEWERFVESALDKAGGKG
ncbi:MAG: GH3 auxin-responsive promoter family protein [Phaeodactylibacter sp.]|nr:GH3 auxin-responsive promoter family protein [Phaeodactylibacter sp.]MCB9277217.1 GH3 auxin-responsive promoter family protein [Lewinellaceae bacterium]